MTRSAELPLWKKILHAIIYSKMCGNISVCHPVFAANTSVHHSNFLSHRNSFASPKGSLLECSWYPTPNLGRPSANFFLIPATNLNNRYMIDSWLAISFLECAVTFISSRFVSKSSNFPAVLEHQFKQVTLCSRVSTILPIWLCCKIYWSIEKKPVSAIAKNTGVLHQTCYSFLLCKVLSYLVTRLYMFNLLIVDCPALYKSDIPLGHWSVYTLIYWSLYFEPIIMSDRLTVVFSI